jgi:hypothetical protein
VIRVDVEVFGFDEVHRYLEGMTRRQFKATLPELQDWGRELVFLAEVLSPKDKLRGKDPRRRPRERSFAKSWRYDIEPYGGKSFELQVGNVDKRRGWIIDGTDPRRIPKKLMDWDNPMFFYWEDGYDGPGFYEDWVITGGVAAHGTPPHPVHIQTLDNFDVAGHIARLASQL